MQETYMVVSASKARLLWLAELKESLFVAVLILLVAAIFAGIYCMGVILDNHRAADARSQQTEQRAKPDRVPGVALWT